MRIDLDTVPKFGEWKWSDSPVVGFGLHDAKGTLIAQGIDWKPNA